MSPFPAAIARARSEFGAGSGFVVAVKPPCTIGKTSVLVMALSLANAGPRNGVSKSLLITKVLSDVGEFLDESGSATLKPCIGHRKAQKALNTCKSACACCVLYDWVSDLRSGRVRRRALTQTSVDNH